MLLPNYILLQHTGLYLVCYLHVHHNILHLHQSTPHLYNTDIKSQQSKAQHTAESNIFFLVAIRRS